MCVYPFFIPSPASWVNPWHHAEHSWDLSILLLGLFKDLFYTIASGIIFLIFFLIFGIDWSGDYWFLHFNFVPWCIALVQVLIGFKSFILKSLVSLPCGVIPLANNDALNCFFPTYILFIASFVLLLYLRFQVSRHKTGESGYLHSMSDSSLPPFSTMLAMCLWHVDFIMLRIHSICL